MITKLLSLMNFFNAELSLPSGFAHSRSPKIYKKVFHEEHGKYKWVEYDTKNIFIDRDKRTTRLPS
jgi:hypothetical protein